jgi:hypothetical protein
MDFRMTMAGLSIGVYRFPIDEAALVPGQTLHAKRKRDYPSLTLIQQSY